MSQGEWKIIIVIKKKSCIFSLKPADTMQFLLLENKISSILIKAKSKLQKTTKGYRERERERAHYLKVEGCNTAMHADNQATSQVEFSFVTAVIKTVF